MRLGRLILVVGTLVTILLFPLLIKDAVQALRLPSAYAAPSFFDAGGRVYQNGNNNDPNNDDDDGGDDDGGDDNDDQSDNEGEDDENENVECYLNLNDNEPVPCDFDDNDNDGVYYPPENDNGYTAPPAAPAPASGYVPPSRRCFGVQEVGDVRLILEGGSITIQVVPASGFSQATWVELDDLEDLSTLPAPPAGATMLDRLVWRMDGGSPCDGPAGSLLSGAVNLGIPYNVPADKSKLQIVMLKNGAWVEVPTSPDPNPNNPYISATVQETGIYAVIQKP